MKMIKDEWQTWVYMLISVAIVLWIVALCGCANEPPTPISRYRAAYGFTP
jgi:hypothetical protein